ncbi:MAG: InlB B-repeat-containing protein, partial [Clostridia bacterium]|nr:InlB B-repeat-containing protein [Clostridia bacterium]
MKGLKKFLLTASLCVGALGLCMGNTATAAASPNDFNCQYAAVAKADSDYVYYGSTAVNTYTAEEAAAKGIPAGYENEVLEVVGPQSRGVLLDFTEQNIPFDLVDAIQFRVYLSTADGNTGAYPQIRIPKPFTPDSWVFQEGVATPTGEWTTVTVPSTKSNFVSLGENGILNKFELAVRSKASINFYIDGISFVFKKPIINYTGSETISVTLGKELEVSATAMDAAGNPLELQYIWENGVELNAKGTPTQLGEYALTLKAVDSYGGETTKELTVVVSEEVVEEVSDFQFIYSANPNKLFGGYGSSAVNTYTAEEAAAKGIPAGYENEVLEVISLSGGSSNGLILDFSKENIPLSLVEGLEFRVYISKNDKNTGNYPQLRISDPNGSGNWVYQKDSRIADGEWTTFTIAKTNNFTSLCDAEGKLSVFELSMRSNGSVNFYIDSIKCVLKADDGEAPVINYAGDDTVSVAMGAMVYLDVTATDAMEGEIPVEYIWDDGVELDANGTPTKIGTYTLTLKAVDYFGNATTKTLTVNVTERDVENPVINCNLNEVKTMAGTKPMFKVTATDNSGNVTLTQTWSEGALDKKGCLTVGTHTWTLCAKDSSDNTTTKTVTFIVTESEPAYSFVTDESDIFGEYTVTFDGENPISVAYGFKITKPADPEKETDAAAKYTFIGWYFGDKQWDFENDVVTGDMDLQARWQETKRVYRITFDGERAKETVAYGDLIPEGLLPAPPSKSPTSRVEYVFEGWALDGKLWDFATDVVTGDTNLVAQFKETPRLYTVTFDGENATEYGYGSKIEKPADPVKESTETTAYEFIGWYYL